MKKIFIKNLTISHKINQQFYSIWSKQLNQCNKELIKILNSQLNTFEIHYYNQLIDKPLRSKKELRDIWNTVHVYIGTEAVIVITSRQKLIIETNNKKQPHNSS